MVKGRGRVGHGGGKGGRGGREGRGGGRGGRGGGRGGHGGGRGGHGQGGLTGAIMIPLLIIVILQIFIIKKFDSAKY